MRTKIEELFERIMDPGATNRTVGEGIGALRPLVDATLEKLERYEAVAEWAKSRGLDDRWGPAQAAQLASDLQSEDAAGLDFGGLVAKLHAVSRPIEFAALEREVPPGADDSACFCSHQRVSHSSLKCEIADCACIAFVEARATGARQAAGERRGR